MADIKWPIKRKMLLRQFNYLMNPTHKEFLMYPYHVTIHFEGPKTTNQMVHLDIFCDAPNQNSGLKHVWI